MGLIVDDPALEIAIVAIVIMVISIIARKFTTDESKQDLMKEKQKNLNAEYKEAINSKDEQRIKAVEEKYKELMGLTKEIMMENFKPKTMLITLVPVMIAFWYLQASYEKAGVIITLPWVNWELTWFWWYLIIALITSLLFENIYQIIRKKLKEGKK